ncbi:hypothetical protein [Marinomonas posidonica]|uniref:Uncharacterized protein n=1 Tax=Marinomonas posidonica (strain CECT 7376 / NCIMB 14433 / IVIA-Po-181) TaxID=491952 RepID=F6CVA5_MARPP|nr:hypothetical protein [Marinomonas posidonica]AEF54215.1 hypothetical protein Mar181_1168 [Marinomonas posidonica IVIA-Po-181]
MQENKEELKKIQSKIIKLMLLDFPGVILVGIGLYGILKKHNNFFLEQFGNHNLAYVSLGLGIFIMALVIPKLIPLLKRQSEIVNGSAT